MLLISSKVGCVFALKFYHEKRARNFLKHVTYVGDGPDNTTCEYTEIGRKYYEYKQSTDYSAKSIWSAVSDWPFPDTCYKSIGSTLRGFSFYFPNLLDSLRNLIQPSPNLINIESRTEEVSIVPTQYSSYPGKQKIEQNTRSYNNVPQKYFINESHFLYDKSDLVKETYITAVNKKILIYGSISYFNKKKQKTKYLK